jgi:eukaryotic-like serine/threonine-protein kinase
VGQLTVLGGRYRLVGRIAAGGMGAVHEGVDERLGRRVAVKVLKEEYADDPAFVERFDREARAAAALGHPNIAQVFDSGQDGDRHFIVMELVEGRHLGEVLAEQGRLAPGQAVSVISQVCSALAAAHEAGIVHRDIKPGNVLIRPDGHAKVTDFGIAHRVGQATLTGTGLVVGTAQYLSPEQASGEAVTPASDVYATGVLLFQLLTGSVPFEGDSPIAVALSHLRDEVPPVRDLAPDVSPALAAVVARATAKDPARRYADGRQMEMALREALASPTAPTATTALPVARSAGAGKPVRRGVARAGPWGLVAAGLLLVGALLAGWMALPDDSSSQAVRPPAATQSGSPSSRPTGNPSSRPTGSPSPTPASGGRSASGPVVPSRAVGRDVKDLEEFLKERGYDVRKVDVDATAPRETVVGTIPAPGQPLTAGQSVVLVSSKGEVREPTRFSVPDSLVGSDIRTAEESLKEHGIEVTRADVHADRPKDTVMATYPAPGATADTGVVVLVVSQGP